MRPVGEIAGAKGGLEWTPGLGRPTIVHLLLVVLWLGRLPCLPSETSETTPAAPEPAPPPRPQEAPALALPNETATYRVTYGVFGEVAQATVTFTSSPASSAAGLAAPVVHAVGSGSGEVFGFGHTDKRIVSEFDARALASMRWTSTKKSDGKMVVDVAEQAQPGAVAIVRKREGQPDQAESFARSAAVLDPLGLLLRIRLAVPTKTTVYEVLDGRGLWLITLTPLPHGRIQPFVRLDGYADPIYWNGQPDKERTARKFTLFLTNDARHLPVQLVIPLGLGEVRADIVTLSRAIGAG